MATNDAEHEMLMAESEWWTNWVNFIGTPTVNILLVVSHVNASPCQCYANNQYANNDYNERYGRHHEIQIEPIARPWRQEDRLTVVIETANAI